ncbi:hypothetical protein [Desulfosporosinus sp. BICA1-9]|nr:hypothetical protein [Desulfosporosinus sp. BICA1-9]
MPQHGNEYLLFDCGELVTEYIQMMMFGVVVNNGSADEKGRGL